MSQDEYFEWQKKCISEMLRVTRHHVFYNIQLLRNNKVALFKLFGFFHDKIKDVVIWDKLSAEPAMGAGVLNSVFEFVIVFSNSEPEKRSFSDVDWRGTVNNIIRNKKHFNTKIAIEQNHSAVMPLNLPRKILSIWSKEGDLIFDPFSGTGTTAIACIKEKRRFIGCEIDKTYFDNSIKRIDAEKSKILLF